MSTRRSASTRARDGSTPEPGGWNRIQLELDDLDGTVATLREAGVPFRTNLITGVGARQALVEDPSGNCVELFEMRRDTATTS